MVLWSQRRFFRTISSPVNQQNGCVYAMSQVTRHCP